MYSQTYPTNRIPLLVILLALCLPVAVGMFPRLNPLILFSAVPIAAAVIAIAYWRPSVFLAFALYASDLKDMRPFNQIQDHVDLTLLALSAVAVSILARSIVKPSAGRFSGVLQPILTFGALLFVVAVSYFHTPAPVYGGFLVTRFALIGGFLFISPFFLMNREEDFRQFAFAYVLMSIMMCFLLYARVDRISASDANVDVTRIASGWSIGLAIVLILFYRVIQSDSRRKLFNLFVLPVLIAGLFAAASRGAILSTILAVIACFFFSPRSKNKVRVLLVGSFVFLLCAIVSFSYLRYMGNGKYQHKLSELIKLSEGDQTQGSGGKRLAFYRSALTEITERPIVGLGVGGWSTYYYGKDEKAHPHDLVLEITTEEGLIGLTALLVFLWSVFRSLNSLVKLSDGYFVALLGTVVLPLTATMFSGDLDDDRVLWFWCGLAVAVLRIVKSQMLQSWLSERAPVWMRPSYYMHGSPRQDLPSWAAPGTPYWRNTLDPYKFR